jgi:phytoene synthase
MEALADLVQTARQDLGTVKVADGAELVRYCYGVAGTVGVMMTCLLGARERQRALPHAVDLGIAMQLTNIARDVLEDAYLSRLYLPADGPAGALAPEDIVAGNEQARHRAWLGVCELLEIAEGYYRGGWQGLGYLPFRARLAIAVAARVYRAIGKRILHRGEEHYWHSRCVVGQMQKFRESVVALAELAFGSSARQTASHDPTLHSNLKNRLYPDSTEQR